MNMNNIHTKSTRSRMMNVSHKTRKNQAWRHPKMLQEVILAKVKIKLLRQVVARYMCDSLWAIRI